MDGRVALEGCLEVSISFCHNCTGEGTVGEGRRHSESESEGDMAASDVVVVVAINVASAGVADVWLM
jgi:hypothetical protein